MIVARLAGRLALPVIGDPVAEPRLDVTVDAVVGDVELAAEIPLRVRQLPVVELAERLEPRHALAAVVLPERLERLVVDLRAERSPAPRTRAPAGSSAPRRDSVSIVWSLSVAVKPPGRTGTGQHLAAAVGDEDEILEPDAAERRVIEAGLERDHVAGDELPARHAAQVRPLVHLEADAVAEPVEEAAVAAPRPSVFVRWVSYPAASKTSHAAAKTVPALDAGARRAPSRRRAPPSSARCHSRTCSEAGADDERPGHVGETRRGAVARPEVEDDRLAVRGSARGPSRARRRPAARARR